MWLLSTRSHFLFCARVRLSVVWRMSSRSFSIAMIQHLQAREKVVSGYRQLKSKNKEPTYIFSSTLLACSTIALWSFSMYNLKAHSSCVTVCIWILRLNTKVCQWRRQRRTISRLREMIDLKNRAKAHERLQPIAILGAVVFGDQQHVREQKSVAHFLLIPLHQLAFVDLQQLSGSFETPIRLNQILGWV